MPRTRDLVVVDVKTSGDRVNVVGHVPIEIAWWNLANGNFGEFIVKHCVHHVTDLGDREALAALRYAERGLGERDQDIDHRELIRLEGHLYDNTLAAVDPARVARLLAHQYSLVPGQLRPQWGSDFPNNEPWHTTLDLASFASGVLGTTPGQPAGLADVAAALDVDRFQAGTAAGDVHAIGSCLLDLIARSEEQHHRAAQLRRFFTGGRRARRTAPALQKATP